MKIVADDKIPYIKGVLEPYAEVVYLPGEKISALCVKDADALLVRTRTKCDAGLLCGSSVRFIGTATIGTDHIDTLWCNANGIEVASAPGSNAGGVLQWIAAALKLICFAKGMAPEQLTLGVIGVGNVGSLVRSYALSWGFRVLCSDPPRERSEGLGCKDGFVPLPEIIGAADIITFHIPLAHDGPYSTYALGSEYFLARTKKGTVIINTSRGGVVDEQALKIRIKEGSAAAFTDTWVGEPDIDRELMELSYIATPHIAGYSAQGKANASSMVIRSLAAFFRLPITDWYPSEVPVVLRRDIGWNEMTTTIDRYFDMAAQSDKLKMEPSRFEEIRKNYDFRTEYF